MLKGWPQKPQESVEGCWLDTPVWGWDPLWAETPFCFGTVTNRDYKSSVLTLRKCVLWIDILLTSSSLRGSCQFNGCIRKIRQRRKPHSLMSALTPAQGSTDCRELCAEQKLKYPALDKEKIFTSKWLYQLQSLEMQHVLHSKGPSRSYRFFQLNSRQKLMD